MDEINEIVENKAKVKDDSKVARYFLGSFFALVTIINVYILSFGFDKETFLVTIIFGLVAVFLFRPNHIKKILAPITPSKEHRALFGKAFQVLVIVIIGYFACRWAIGNTDITSVPLGQLTLSNIGSLILEIILIIFFAKAALSVITNND